MKLADDQASSSFVLEGPKAPKLSKQEVDGLAMNGNRRLFRMYSYMIWGVQYMEPQDRP